MIYVHLTQWYVIPKVRRFSGGLVVASFLCFTVGNGHFTTW
jgi:hypothetical protein